MGIGSPRVLGKLIRRVALTFAVALGLAPSAYAENSIAAPSIPSVPASAAVSVGIPAAPLPEAAPGLPLPSREASVAMPKLPRVPVVNAPPSATPATSTDAVIHHERNAVSAHRTSKRGSQARLLSSSAVRGPNAPRTAVLSARPAAVSPAPSGATHASTLPSSRSVGSSGPAGSGSPMFSPLLFALVSALPLIGAQRLGRRVGLFASPLRPYDYLLRLERPD